MKEYILKRLAMLIFVLLGVSIITFALVRAAPGDPAIYLAGQHATPEKLEEIREKYHLNDPIYEQYLIWLKMALHGDLGKSIQRCIQNRDKEPCKCYDIYRKYS